MDSSNLDLVFLVVQNAFPKMFFAKLFFNKLRMLRQRVSPRRKIVLFKLKVSVPIERKGKF